MLSLRVSNSVNLGSQLPYLLTFSRLLVLPLSSIDEVVGDENSGSTTNDGPFAGDMGNLGNMAEGTLSSIELSSHEHETQTGEAILRCEE